MELWELVAREEIRDLVARYNANNDSGRFDQVVELFAPDAVMESEGQTYAGQAEIRRLFEESKGEFGEVAGFTHLRHLTGTHQIDLLGPTQARGRLYYAVLMDHGLDHWGVYRDSYGLVDGRWRFTHRRVSEDGHGPRPG